MDIILKLSYTQLFECVLQVENNKQPQNVNKHLSTVCRLSMNSPRLCEPHNWTHNLRNYVQPWHSITTIIPRKTTTTPINLTLLSRNLTICWRLLLICVCICVFSPISVMFFVCSTIHHHHHSDCCGIRMQSENWSLQYELRYYIL